MMAEFRRLAADGITDEELRARSGQLGGASALALEDSDTRMTRLGRSELTFGEFSDLDETLRRIAARHARTTCRRSPPTSSRARCRSPPSARSTSDASRDWRRRRLSRRVHRTTQDPPDVALPLPRAPRRAAGCRARPARRPAQPARRAPGAARSPSGSAECRSPARGLAAAARAGDRAHHDRADAGARAAAVRAADGLHPVGPEPDMPHAFESFFGGVTADEIEAGEAQMADAVAEWLAPARDDRHDLLITHNFVIGWFVREVFGAPKWRWLGLNQANCGLTIIRVRSAKPPVLVTHNDLGHLPVELRTGHCRDASQPRSRARRRAVTRSSARCGSAAAWRTSASRSGCRCRLDLEVAARAVERVRRREAARWCRARRRARRSAAARRSSSASRCAPESAAAGGRSQPEVLDLEAAAVGGRSSIGRRRSRPPCRRRRTSSRNTPAVRAKSAGREVGGTSPRGERRRAVSKYA